MKPLGAGQMIIRCLVLAAMIEGVTIVFRFGFGWEAAKIVPLLVGPLTGGLRIHHAYVGLAATALAAALWRCRPSAARWLLVIGMALALSDAVHHFLVLWPLVGSPEFHIWIVPLGHWGGL